MLVCVQANQVQWIRLTFSQDRNWNEDEKD